MKQLEHTLNESLLEDEDANNKKTNTLQLNTLRQNTPKICLKISVKSSKIQKEPKINPGLRHILDTLSHCVGDITISCVYLGYLLLQTKWQGLSAFRNIILGVLNMKLFAEVLMYQTIIKYYPKLYQPIIGYCSMDDFTITCFLKSLKLLSVYLILIDSIVYETQIVEDISKDWIYIAVLTLTCLDLLIKCISVFAMKTYWPNKPLFKFDQGLRAYIWLYDIISIHIKDLFDSTIYLGILLFNRQINSLWQGNQEQDEQKFIRDSIQKCGNIVLIYLSPMMFYFINQAIILMIKFSKVSKRLALFLIFSLYGSSWITVIVGTQFNIYPFSYWVFLNAVLFNVCLKVVSVSYLIKYGPFCFVRETYLHNWYCDNFVKGTQSMYFSCQSIVHYQDGVDRDFLYTSVKFKNFIADKVDEITQLFNNKKISSVLPAGFDPIKKLEDSEFRQLANSGSKNIESVLSTSCRKFILDQQNPLRELRIVQLDKKAEIILSDYRPIFGYNIHRHVLAERFWDRKIQLNVLNKKVLLKQKNGYNYKKSIIGSKYNKTIVENDAVTLERDLVEDRQRDQNRNDLILLDLKTRTCKPFDNNFYSFYGISSQFFLRDKNWDNYTIFEIFDSIFVILEFNKEQLTVKDNLVEKMKLGWNYLKNNQLYANMLLNLIVYKEKKKKVKFLYAKNITTHNKIYQSLVYNKRENTFQRQNSFDGRFSCIKIGQLAVIIGRVLMNAYLQLIFNSEGILQKKFEFKSKMSFVEQPDVKLDAKNQLVYFCGHEGVEVVRIDFSR